ncbi:hypothetical protein [Dyadobacter sp. NIV53]|uniref:hypothetical protein n=1 Tax=Dyadobacter sp. NIV53 TaxID=2861765 RepID=UPI001C86F5EF|nr:hypothetical protein [Dyadobacter sp. NIV53]
MSGKNILYLFESAVGIGHQRRASGIINGLALAGFNVFAASGTFIEPEKYFDPRVSLIILPEPRRNKDGIMSYYNRENICVADPDYDYEKWKETRIHALRDFLENNSVEAVFAEWWPFQRRSDFDPLVSFIIKTQQYIFGRKPMIISSLRDVIQTDNKEILQSNGRKDKSAIEIINCSVDLVLVHSDQHFVKLEHGVEKHNLIKKPVIYTGYVVHEEAKTDLYQRREKTVLVSCGSGHDGYYLIKAALLAMPFSNMKDHQWHFVLGPRMQPVERHKIHTVVENMLHEKPELKILVHDQLAELPKSLAGAGISVSLAGYNTTMEVLASRVPSVLIPKFVEHAGKITKIEGEQWDRLQLLRDKKMANIAHPADVLIPEKFAAIIDHAFITGLAENTLNMNGISYTAELMVKLFPFDKPLGNKYRPVNYRISLRDRISFSI